MKKIPKIWKICIQEMFLGYEYIGCNTIYDNNKIDKDIKVVIIKNYIPNMTKLIFFKRKIHTHLKSKKKRFLFYNLKRYFYKKRLLKIIPI